MANRQGFAAFAPCLQVWPTQSPSLQTLEEIKDSIQSPHLSEFQEIVGLGCWPRILPSLPRAPSVSDLLPQPKPKAIERVMRFLASCWVWSRPRASPHPTQPGVHGCRDGLASLRPPLLSAAGTEFCAHSLTSAGRKQETGLMGQPSHQSVCPQGRQHPDCVTFAGGAGVGVVTSVVSDSVTMDCSPPGFSVHGILQARMLEWVAIPLSRGSSQLKVWTWVSCVADGFSTIWVTREVHVDWNQATEIVFQFTVNFLSR